MEIHPSIVCVGTAALDTISVVDHVPGEDERVESDAIVTAGGGNAATSAVTIARLGLAVEFAGVVGCDDAGGAVLAQLESEGVGVSLVERRAGVATAHSIVLVSKSTALRAIVTRPAPIPSAIPGGFDWVHLDKAGYRALRAGGGGRGARTSLDDGNPVDGLDLGLIDLYVPTAAVLTRRFASDDSVEAARRARAQGAGTVVATDGAAGSFALDGEGLAYAAGLPIRPMSTLGAGDVFHGAIIAALALGKPLPDALVFANVTAALSCRGLDGRSMIPGRDEVERVVATLERPSLSTRQIEALLGASPHLGATAPVPHSI